MRFGIIFAPLIVLVKRLYMGLEKKLTYPLLIIIFLSIAFNYLVFAKEGEIIVERFYKSGILNYRFFENPLSYRSVPEAKTGFTWPLPYKFHNNGGRKFLEGVKNEYAFHPGEDWNVTEPPGGRCNGDKGLRVNAAADGVVVFIQPYDGCIILEHNYKGDTFFTVYVHVQNINPKLDIGDFVYKGDKIAEIGDVHAKCAHLHFEIRNAGHPEPHLPTTKKRYSEHLVDFDFVTTCFEPPYEFIPEHNQYE